jgi:hypothetical protein
MHGQQNIKLYNNSCVEQGCTNPGSQVGRTNEFCYLASNIYRSSLCSMLRVTILTYRSFRWLPDFRSFCSYPALAIRCVIRDSTANDRTCLFELGVGLICCWFTCGLLYVDVNVLIWSIPLRVVTNQNQPNTTIVLCKNVIRVGYMFRPGMRPKSGHSSENNLIKYNIWNVSVLFDPMHLKLLDQIVLQRMAWWWPDTSPKCVANPDHILTQYNCCVWLILICYCCHCRRPCSM